jgi:hypothetical protein
MIPVTAFAYLQALEDAMPLKPRVRVKAQGIPIAGVLVKTTDTGKTVIVKKDTAPPHVRAGRRRKAGKVTGARAAK